MARVAKINPVKVKQDAEKEEKAGRFDKAIALYRDLVADNPRDWNTIKKIGDLYARMNKIKEASQEFAKVADFYARDGFLLKAIAVWKQINKLDASALEPYLNLADLYAKQGLMVEAKGQYQIVVDEYIKRGRIREAGDALKQMADIDPSDLKVRSRLADLYTRDGNSAKAVGEHVAIAEELGRKGHMAEALQVLEKGLKIDPKSAKLRIELARIHLVQKNYDKAIHYLEDAAKGAPSDAHVQTRLGEAYLGAKRVEEGEAIFRRLLQTSPEDHDARTQMGRVFLIKGQFDQAFEQLLPVVDKLVERREGERAATLLQQIAQRNPAHIKSLVKLVEIYRLLRKESAVADTYSQLTEAYINQGQMERAASVLQILVDLEPQNEQHRSKLEFVRGKKGGRPAAPRPAAGPALVEEEFDLGAPEPLRAAAARAPITAPRSVPAGMAIELSGPLSEEDKEFIEEHLAEGRVFRKYGLVDKSVEQFEAIIARFPDHVDARQELRDVFKEKGQNDKAAEQCLALAEVCRLKGDPAAARHEADAKALQPAAEAPAPPAPAVRPAAPPSAPAEARPEEEIPLEVEESGLEEPALESEEAGVSADELALELGEPEQELTGGFLEEEPASPLAEPALEGLTLGSDELALEEPPPAPTPAPPAARLKPAPSRIGQPAVGPAPGPPSARKVPLVPKAPPAAAARGIPDELQRVLEEVESYISLGFVDDAQAALAEIESRFPDHPAIAEKRALLGLGTEAAPAPAVAAPSLEDLVEEPAEAEGLLSEPPLTEPLADLALDAPAPPTPALAQSGAAPDLGAELEDLFGAQSAVEEPAPTGGGTDLGDAGLSEIFKEFKRGVDKQLDKEDYDTRYNLGIAYKEMGLIDEAIAEFQLAAKDESRLLECASMLGICFMEKGMAKLAVKWFEKGLQAEGRSDEEYQGLRYDLATALEAAGETDKALSVYTDLYGQDANFRDVATKVRELRAALQ